MTKDEYRANVLAKLDTIVKALTAWPEAPFEPAPEKYIVGETIAVKNFDVPETTVDGQHFEAVHVRGAKLVVVDTDDERTIAMFDHVLFDSAVSENYNSEQFKDTPLGKYLNGPFRDAFWRRSLLQTDKDVQVLNVALPTKYEMFGEGEPESAFDEKPRRFDFFRAGINRIRFDGYEDYSRWYWLASREKDTSSCFARVRRLGYACWATAYDVGGVSPAVRIH